MVVVGLVLTSPPSGGDDLDGNMQRSPSCLMGNLAIAASRSGIYALGQGMPRCAWMPNMADQWSQWY